MGDEDTGVEPEETNEEEPEETLTETEELAVEIGWNPDHEGEDTVDARTYILNSRDIQDSMRKKNKSSDREISRLTTGLENVKDYYRNLDTARARKMETEIGRLKKERDEAIEDGDVDKVKGIDAKIEESKEEAIPLMEEDTDNPEFDDWQGDNTWYGSDKEMTEYAEAQASLDKYKGVPYTKVLSLIKKSTEKMFPEKFEKQTTKTTPAKVEATRTVRTNKTATKADLTSDQKEIMKSVLSVSEDMTEKEFIKGLQEAGEIS